MALYPRQTHLPINVLKDNGLYTELVPLSTHSERRFHPFEWAFALGWPSYLQLPIDLEEAWRNFDAGNSFRPLQ